MSAAAGAPRRRPGSEALPVAEPEPPRRSRRPFAIAAGVLAALLLAVGAVSLLSGGDEATRPAGTASTSTGNDFVDPSTVTTPTAPAAPTVEPGEFAVYVLNGTQQNGIAAEVAKTLETDGYRSAGTGNAAVNTAPTTEVFYLDGKKSGATAVARKLDVATANVKPAGRDITVQGPGADVIVQIGADKANG